jgi:hypothetical protein
MWGNASNRVMLNPSEPMVADAVGLARFSVDVSRPPPPAPQWGHGMDSAGNTHRKLARQLTLNPAYDPRIHGARYVADSGDPYSVPPPSLVSNFNQHFAVKRNASAPEPCSQQQPPLHHLSRSPVPLQIESELSDIYPVMPLLSHHLKTPTAAAAMQPNFGGPRVHVPLPLPPQPQQYSSDLKLCKSKSE